MSSAAASSTDGSAVAAASSSASSSSSSPSGRVLIIGGGIAGCTLALFLARAGIEAAVFEAYPEFCSIVGGVLLGPNGARVLESLGLFSALKPRGTVFSTLQIKNARGDVLGGTETASKARYGIEGVACSRLAIHGVLHEGMEARGLRIRYGKRLVNIVQTQYGVKATFEDGSTAEGSMLVGADGLHSRTRNLIFPDGAQPQHLGLMSLGGSVHEDAVPAALRASMPEAGTMALSIGARSFVGVSLFGLHPVDSRSLFGFWTAVPQPLLSREELAALSDQDVHARLLSVFSESEGWSSSTRALVDLACSPSAPDPPSRVQLFDVPDLPTWSRGRCIIIGDAAHAMSPNSGQGVSQALEDAMCLAVLIKRRKGELSQLQAVRAVCTEYEHHRKPRSEKLKRDIRAKDAAIVASYSTAPRPGSWSLWARDLLIRAVLRWNQGVLPWSRSSLPYEEEFSYKCPGFDEI